MTSEEKTNYTKANELTKQPLRHHPFACYCKLQTSTQTDNKDTDGILPIAFYFSMNYNTIAPSIENVFIPCSLFDLFFSETELDFSNKGLNDHIGCMIITCLMQDKCKVIALDLSTSF